MFCVMDEGDLKNIIRKAYPEDIPDFEIGNAAARLVSLFEILLEVERQTGEKPSDEDNSSENITDHP